MGVIDISPKIALCPKNADAALYIGTVFCQVAAGEIISVVGGQRTEFHRHKVAILWYMDTELDQRLKEQDQKLDAIWQSVEKSRKYFLAVLWITVIVVVLPLIGLVFAIPAFLSSYSVGLEGLI